MNMPGMDGIETCKLIRAQSEIAIIMLTVRDDETDKVAAAVQTPRAAGAHPGSAPADGLNARPDGSHRELLQAVWGPDYGDEVDYLRVFVNQLRKKIEPKASSPTILLTEPWVGYRLYLPDRQGTPPKS